MFNIVLKFKVKNRRGEKMIETILIALLVSKIKKYKLKPIFKSWTIYPMLTLCILYILLELMIFKGIYYPIKYTNIFKSLMLFSVFILVLKYKLYVSSAIGSVFVLIGSLFNYIAIKSNNGKMPVFISLSKLTGYAKSDAFNKVNDIHIIGTSATKFKILTDIFDVGYCIMSIGDILIRVFVFIIIYKAIQCANYKLAN